MSKTVFLDLDGTLLNNQKKITAENCAAIAEAVARGNRVVLTSGRPLATIRPLLDELSMWTDGSYAICYNGAMIYDCGRKKVIFEKTIPLSIVNKISAKCDELNLHLHSYDDEFLLTREYDEESQYYVRVTGIKYKALPEFPKGLTEEPHKVIIIDLRCPEKLSAFRQYIIDELDSDIDSFYTPDYFLELVPKGMSKASAIRMLVSILGLDMKDTIAVGDSENDLPMIKACALGCAMNNAISDCINAADYVTENDCNNSGVAEVINKFVLNS